MPCPTVATMASPIGTRAGAARVRAGLAVLLMIAGTALVGAVPAAAGTDVRTVEERVTVPAGPGEPGTIGLDTTLLDAYDPEYLDASAAEDEDETAARQALNARMAEWYGIG